MRSFSAARGGGKAQPYDARVLTPDGWAQIGRLKVGSKICASDGTITEVIGVYPQGIKPIYKITMRDGGTTLASDEHVWLSFGAGKRREIKGVRVHGEDAWKKRTTLQLIRDIDAAKHKKGTGVNYRMSLPLPTAPLQFNGTTRNGPKRVVDPYILGLLLGDGTFTTKTFSILSADNEIIDYVKNYAKNDIGISRKDIYDHYGINYGPSDNTYQLRLINATGEKIYRHFLELGLYKKISDTKFVPRLYLWANEDVRLGVLQGLMDTDGTVHRGTPVFSTVSPQLRDDVIFLVRSLGGTASYYTEKSEYTYRDERLEGKDIYRVSVRISNPSRIFKLTRKKVLCIEPRLKSRSIEKIEFVENKECVCIQVAHPNSLYITDDFIVTHNSDGILGEFAAHADQDGENAIGLCVRRERTQLLEIIERSKKIYEPLGAKFGEQDKMWRFPNGARLRFAYLENDSDAQAYQGHSYSRIFIEELGTFPSPEPILKLMATLSRNPKVRSKFIATGNPGGPGHLWIKQRYVDPDPKGMRIIKTEFKNPFTNEKVFKERIFIPSGIRDNIYTNTPEYIGNLYMSGNEELVKAWLMGDWNVTLGAFFPEFSMEKHVIKSFVPPKHWTRFMAMDWGSSTPFSIGWYCVVPDEFDAHLDLPLDAWAISGEQKNQGYLPKGAIIKYREWYGSLWRQNIDNGMPNAEAITSNTGLKLTAKEVARGIVEREINEPKGQNGRARLTWRVADPKIFSSDNGPSVAENFNLRPYHVNFTRADNKRVQRAGAMSGWDELRNRLKGIGGEEGKVGTPTIYFMNCCVDTIRTLPALQHDPKRIEDAYTHGEDHAPDETRYACMSRPYSQTNQDTPVRGIIRARDNSVYVKDDIENLRAPSSINQGRIH